MKKGNLQLEASTIKIIKALATQLKKDGISAFLFGSRATGTAKERSDIDIGLQSNNKINTEIIENFKENLEKIPTFYKFDVVDFANTSEEFKNFALKKTYALN